MWFSNDFNLFFLTLLSIHKSQQVAASFSDYIKTIGSYFNSGEASATNSELYAQKIPYEVSTVDEKFISEAAKLTGVALSELDSCQHRVVLKLKSDCDNMNDEQLAKMAVHLLNCQSYVEGRPIFPCTDDMSIKDCTRSMDSDTWTSYHIMSNRARAVCYSIRQLQFRGLAEHTVNRLMGAAQEQMRTLEEIAVNQHNLQEKADNTLSSLTEGHTILSNQQKDIQRAQFHGQLALEDNIKRLTQEKELIADTHNQLVHMTRGIQERLEESSKSLQEQVGDTRKNHEELLDDLVAIQSKAHAIFDRIEESSSLLMQQNEHFKIQYEETLRNLAEVNRTVNNLVTLVGGTRQVLEERLQWVTQALGGTDLAVERLYIILWHSAFMLVTMLTCAFLSAQLTTRIVVAMLPPINLTVALWRSDYQVGPLALGGTILGFVIGQTLIISAMSFKTRVKQALPSLKIQEVVHKRASPIGDGDNLSTNVCSDEVDNFDISFVSPTPPLSRSSYYRPRSRSSTPCLVNGAARSGCKAKTRVGLPCKLSSLPGRDYCYRHQSGDSVIG